MQLRDGEQTPPDVAADEDDDDDDDKRGDDDGSEDGCTGNLGKQGVAALAYV